MDSPFCQPCLRAGKLSNTFKVVGIAKFKCGTCKRFSEPGDYKPLDFEWRNKFQEWEVSIRGRFKDANQKIPVGEMDRIKTVGQR